MKTTRLYRALGWGLALALAANAVSTPRPARSANQYGVLQTLNNPNPIDGGFGNPEAFGTAVLWANGTTAVVGAPGKIVNGLTFAGAVYVYNNLASSSTPAVVITASQYVMGAARFGQALATVGAPTQLVIGAPSDSLAAIQAGAAYRFDLSGTLVQTVTRPSAANGDFFGGAVASINDDLVVGAKQVATYKGEICRFSGATCTPTQTLAGAAPLDEFGSSLAVSGTLLFVGAPGANSNDGVVNAYDLSGPSPTLTWVYSHTSNLERGRFGTSLAIHNNRLLVGELDYGTHGRAYLIDVTTHAFLHTFEQPDILVGGNEKFGAAVSIYGGQVLIGAPGYDATPLTTNDTGAAYLFSAEGPYELIERLDNPAATPGDAFGSAVAVGPGSDQFLIGAPYADVSGVLDAGRVYVFSLGVSYPLYLPLIMR